MGNENVVRALFTMHVSESEMMFAGNLYVRSHPLVRAHPDWFSDDLETVAIGYTPPIETATADPGEKRAVRARG